MGGLQNAQYVIKGSNVISGKTYRTYVCRRSCETATYYYKEYVFGESSDVEIRPSRTKSTCKMNARCASRFLGNYWAWLLSTCAVFPIHTGHNPSDPNEMQHLRLSMFLRRQITMQQLNKVDEKSIVRCINHSEAEIPENYTYRYVFAFDFNYGFIEYDFVTLLGFFPEWMGND